MKHLFIQLRFMLFLLVVIPVLFACEQNEKSNLKTPIYTPIEERTQNNLKIGFLMDTLLEERWVKDRELFKEAVESRGAEIEIMEAHGNDVLQIWQAETMISNGIDLLVIVPHNAETTAAIVKKAHAAGIKVLSYDRLVKNAEVDMYVSYDNEKVGELQALAITNLVPQGKYVYIGGAETDYNAHLLKKGVFNVLQPFIKNGNITIVFDQWTKDWVPENAKANIQLALEANDNQIDAIIAANDATAGAVIGVLEERGLAGEIPVAGQDADIAAVQRIVEGTQAMTVYKPINDLSEKAAELAVILAKGEEVLKGEKVNNELVNVPSFLLTPIAVDQSNIDETIIADGFHKKEDVYKSLNH
ncbi:substrate-binding domain-containing protein [Alkalihalobacillus sp. MEB130]|uniref:sugar ABC transporter substrate-binding protein n=1 Tax=Alkalihalobacillus sp. MEB130 TaxID=2976704 RepID=UPI0028DDB2A7|nr:substrate-binding domain-containing protein [Alkalihalobacillus sp. MEB130]MDT8860706.1 substrate-binding domain-containing protein [Alkalihalobacillus sp. MEB130]